MTSLIDDILSIRIKHVDLSVTMICVKQQWDRLNKQFLLILLIKIFLFLLLQKQV